MSVDDRLQIIGLDRGDHISLMRLAANSDAADTGILLEEFCRGHLAGEAGQHTDHAYAAVEGDGAHRLRHST